MRSNAQKIYEKLIVRRGGSTLTVSLSIKVLFLNHRLIFSGNPLFTRTDQTRMFWIV